MENVRIIKKYPNRRLYDTTDSRYITLNEIKAFVLNHIEFKVIDLTTQEDMTNDALLQIIGEEESGCSPIFTTQILKHIIRFYGNPYQKVISQFLEKNLLFATEHQNDFQNPFKVMTNLAQQNMALWESLYSQDHDKPKRKSKKASSSKKSAK